MNTDLLDAEHLSNPDSWDSKTRIKISDAIIEVNDHVKKVKYGRFALIALAGLNLVGALMLISSGPIAEVPESFRWVVLGVTLALSMPYIVGAIFFAKNPKIWLGVGLITYVISTVLASLGQGTFDGFIWKIAIISALSYAIYSASEWKKNLNKLKELGFPRGELEEARTKLLPLKRLQRRIKHERKR